MLGAVQDIPHNGSVIDQLQAKVGEAGGDALVLEDVKRMLIKAHYVIIDRSARVECVAQNKPFTRHLVCRIADLQSVFFPIREAPIKDAVEWVLSNDPRSALFR